MYEQRQAALLSRPAFARRVARHFAASTALVALSLIVGIVGYRLTEGMPWIDAFLNAAMLMGGMGPVGDLHTVAGKLFAGVYAMYCGLVLIVAVGVVAAPIVHRVLHHFHQEVDPGDAKLGGEGDDRS